MPEPRTIDNLGVDISTRYAEDQKKLDQKLIKDSGLVSSQTEIDVMSPSYDSEWELLFQTRRQVSWADFYAPPKYGEQKKRLFTFQIVPSLGTEDKIEDRLQRINGMFNAPAEEREEEREKKKKQEAYPWEEEREKQEREKEKKILVNLLNTISLLDKFLADINSRRNQYQKG